MPNSMALPLIRVAARKNALTGYAASVGRFSRYFGTSPSHHVRVVFGEASNDELRTTLDEIQEKITLPAHLPKAQRAILRDPKRKNYIEQNPVTIEIEGLEHKYTKVIPRSDVPNSKHLFKKAIRSMQTQEDWANLESLLAGYKKAGVVLKPMHFGMASRLAVSDGQLYSLIDCARHVVDTGYLLTTDESGLLVVKAIADRAMTNDHAQAIKWLSQLQDILERPPHSDLSGLQNLRSSKTARGMMLSARLADIQASETPSETQLNHLSDEVERLRALWTRTLDSLNGPLQLDIDELSLNSFRRKTPTKGDGSLSKPLVRGIVRYHLTAMIAHNIKAFEGVPAVLGQSCEPLPDVSKRLDEYLTERVKECAEADEHVQSHLPRLARAYYDILGRSPTWAEPAVEEEKGQSA